MASIQSIYEKSAIIRLYKGDRRQAIFCRFLHARIIMCIKWYSSKSPRELRIRKFQTATYNFLERPSSVRQNVRLSLFYHFLS